MTADLILAVLLWVALVAAKNEGRKATELGQVSNTHNVVLNLFVDGRGCLVSFSLRRRLLGGRRNLFGSLFHCFGSRW